MPAQPVWYHRLDAILGELRAMDLEYLDRLAVERIFGVRERRARQLMAGLPCLQVGNAVAVKRTAMIVRLEETASGSRFQWEIRRRERVVETVDTLRKQAAARRIQIPVAERVQDASLGSLPAGIDLRAGELRIRFCGPEDLAAKLFALSQAMAEDWPSVERILGEST